jgi:hypothetical protein
MFAETSEIIQRSVVIIPQSRSYVVHILISFKEVSYNRNCRLDKYIYIPPSDIYEFCYKKLSPLHMPEFKSLLLNKNEMLDAILPCLVTSLRFLFAIIDIPSCPFFFPCQLSLRFFYFSRSISHSDSQTMHTLLVCSVLFFHK